MFMKRLREVNGLELGNVPRAPAIKLAAMPSYVPVVYHGNRRERLLVCEAVALPLHKL